MSKIPTSPVEFGDIAYLPQMNFGRGFGDDARISDDPSKHTGDDKRLISSIAAHGGWNPLYPATIGSLTDALRDEAVALREAYLKKAEALASSSLIMEIMFVVATIRFGTVKKVRVPKFLGITGNRRNMAFPHAVVQRLMTDDDSHPEYKRKESESVEAWVRRLFSFDIPFVWSEATTPEQYRIVQIIENTMSKEGKKEVSPSVNLMNAKVLIESGMKQYDIQKTFGSIGQKLYGIVKLSENMPQARLLERLTADPDKIKDAIPFGKLPTNLANIIAATHPDESVNEDYKSKTKNKDLHLNRITDLGEFEKWLQTTVAGKKAEPMMEQKDVVDLMSTHSQNPLIVATLKAVKHADTAYLAGAKAFEVPVKALYVIKQQPTVFDEVVSYLVEKSTAVQTAIENPAPEAPAEKPKTHKARRRA